MWALVYGLKHFRFGDNAVVLISASIFSILHATVSLVWLLPSFWAFLLYGSAMIVWSGRSTKLGFFGALLPHALNNAFVFFVAFLDQRYGLS